MERGEREWEEHIGDTQGERFPKAIDWENEFFCEFSQQQGSKAGVLEVHGVTGREPERHDSAPVEKAGRTWGQVVQCEDHLRCTGRGCSHFLEGT